MVVGTQPVIAQLSSQTSTPTVVNVNQATIQQGGMVGSAPVLQAEVLIPQVR